MPDQIDEEGILVGWSLEHEYRFPPIGFHYGDERFTPATGFLNPILFEGEGHLMTIAPTGSGKGTGCIIPTLLRHEGPVIVIDPKGENAAVTARRRREMGQKVLILDPLEIADQERAHLNPFDLLDKNSVTLTDDVAMLMNILVPDEVSAKDQFWISRSQQLLIGLTLHLIIDHEPKHHNLAALRNIINQGHQQMQEVAQSMQRSQHPDVRSIASNILIPAPETFGGILSFAQNAVGFMRGELVQKATGDSTFSYDEITRGDPISLYLIIPSDKLESHGSLLKIWVGSLIAAITRRQAPPPKPTLFMLDEAAQLGPLPQLRQAITLLRGYGLQTWSFWQDVSQLHRLYPADWETMVNNCKVLQAFGANNMNAASAMAGLTGFSQPREILDLDFNEMILLIGGDEAVISQRPDYLKDPMFRGMHDDNPRHDLTREILPKPRKPQRIYSRPPSPVRPPSGDPVHPPEPLWSSWERNAMGEVVGVRRLEGPALFAKIEESLKEPKQHEWPMSPLISGKWKDLVKMDAIVALANIWPHLVPNFGQGLTSIDGVRSMPLSIYQDTWLYEARCSDSLGFLGYLTWFAASDKVVQLTGTSPPIHQFNSSLPPRLDKIGPATEYLHFFCAAVHGQEGAFRIVESKADLRYFKLPDEGLDEDVFKKIKPCVLKPVPPDEDNESQKTGSPMLWKADCVIQYGDSLFESELFLKKGGMVEMTGDSPIVKSQPFRSEIFKTGVRTYEPRIEKA